MGKKLDRVREIAKSIKSYYETDDFKGNYADCLLEDTANCHDKIVRYLTGYEFKYKNGFAWDKEVATLIALAIYAYMKWNVDEFMTDAYAMCWSESFIDGVMFGEQCEQLTDFYDAPNWEKHKEKYRKAFEELDFYVDENCKYAFYDLSYDGVALDLDNGVIPIDNPNKMLEWLNEWQNELTDVDMMKISRYIVKIQND